MRTSQYATAAALAASLVLSSAETQAGDIPVARRSAAGADVWLWSARGNGTTIPIVGFFNYEITNDVYLDIRLPIAPNFYTTSRFGLGNPHGGVRYAPQALGGRLTWFVGGRAGVPLADVDDGDWFVANVRAAAAMALYDSYYWLPYLPVSGMVGIEYRPIDMIWLRASADPILYFPLRSRYDFEGVFQNRFEFQAETDSGIGGGLAIQAVLYDNPGGSFGGGNQFSIEPFFNYDNNSFIFRGGFLIALDAPLGFGFKRERVFSPHVQIGGHF